MFVPAWRGGANRVALSVSRRPLYTENSARRGAARLSAPPNDHSGGETRPGMVMKSLESGSGGTKPHEFGAMEWHRYAIFAGKARSSVTTFLTRTTSRGVAGM